MSVPRVEVLVVGGGIVGVAIADELARRGVGTLLLERHRLASGASGGAAGVATPPLEAARPAPFLELALVGRDLLRREAPRLVAETGVDIGYEPSGVLQVAGDEAEAEAIRAQVGSARARQMRARWLDPEELRELEPELAARLRGAAHFPDDLHVVSSQLVRALAARALRHGATIREGVSVRRLLRVDGKVIGARTDEGELRSRVVVLAAGPWTADLTSVSVPVRPVKGQLAYLRPERPLLRRPVFGADVYLVPKPDGRLVVGATEEDAGFDTTPREEVSRELVARAAEFVPAVRELPIDGAWAGLRPTAPDRLPVIGAHRDLPGAIFATGHFRNGVLLSLITARIVAALVMGEETLLDVAPFSPERFASGTA